MLDLVTGGDDGLLDGAVLLEAQILHFVTERLGGGLQLAYFVGRVRDRLLDLAVFLETKILQLVPERLDRLQGLGHVSMIGDDGFLDRAILVETEVLELLAQRPGRVAQLDDFVMGVGARGLDILLSPVALRLQLLAQRIDRQPQLPELHLRLMQRVVLPLDFPRLLAHGGHIIACDRFCPVSRPCYRGLRFRGRVPYGNRVRLGCRQGPAESILMEPDLGRTSAGSPT